MRVLGQELLRSLLGDSRSELRDLFTNLYYQNHGSLSYQTPLSVYSLIVQIYSTIQKDIVKMYNGSLI